MLTSDDRCGVSPGNYTEQLRIHETFQDESFPLDDRSYEEQSRNKNQTSLYWTNSHKKNSCEKLRYVLVVVVVMVVVVIFFRSRMPGQFLHIPKPGAPRGHALKCHSCALKHHAHAACS